MTSRKSPILVVGGGLAGLATSAYLAKAGRSVRLLERSTKLGGRAATRESNGFFLNFGPHALYAKGAGRAVLDELGVEVSGRYPPTRGLYALDGGETYLLPTSPTTLLRTRLLRWSEKLEILRFLATLPKLDTTPHESMTVKHWLETQFQGEQSRGLVEALFRLTTYAHAPAHMGAGAALRQLQLAVSGNVLYLHRGWQRIVDGLRRAALAAGAVIETSSPVVEVRVGSVTLDSGRTLQATAVVLAVDPSEVSRLVRTLQVPEPIRAACLDVAVERLPEPGANFCLGIDEPLYFSVHSSTARLAPAGSAMIHVARYLAPGESADATSLEAFLDVMQPGWREVVVERRFLPQMTVSHAIVPPGGRGIDVGIPGIERVFITGDWVGPTGMLADAALASARRVAARLGAVEMKAAA